MLGRKILPLLEVILILVLSENEKLVAQKLASRFNNTHSSNGRSYSITKFEANIVSQKSRSSTSNEQQLGRFIPRATGTEGAKTYLSSTGEKYLRLQKRKLKGNEPPLESGVIPIDGNPSTSIIRYLEEAHFPHMITLMKWNSSGILDRTSPIYQQNWSPYNNIELFERTKPSEYGTVAFFLNTDILKAATWKDVPPIPFLSYTLPNTIASDGDPYSIIPTPYDRSGFNRACIRHAEQVTHNTTFYERKNVMIWRGIPHLQADINRRILVNISKLDPDNTWLDAVNIDEEPDKSMERTEMSLYKYQIDIGGVSGTTWGSLRWKMCSGNLVFKVDSWSRDWWYDTIEEWKHYIPVKSDLSDLREKYEWAENHPDEAFKIVEDGTKKCKETVTEEYVNKFQLDVIESIRPATLEQIREVDAILDGYGSFYEPIIVEQKKLEQEKKDQTNN